MVPVHHWRDVRSRRPLRFDDAPSVTLESGYRSARGMDAEFAHADFDSLTGLYNRRYFQSALREEVAHAHRDGRPLALILIDIDEFKSVNERVGHAAADEALTDLAGRLRGLCDLHHVPARIGGDEFAVVLPGGTLNSAVHVSEQLDDDLSATPFDETGSLPLTYGIVQLDAGEDSASLLARADDALYRGKHNPPYEGGSGVREPRRPKPSTGGATESKPISEEN